MAKDHFVVLFVGRLGKLVTVFFSFAWIWLLMMDPGQGIPRLWQDYLRYGIAGFVLAVGAFVILRGIIMLGGYTSKAEWIEVISSDNSKWETLENRLIYAGLLAALIGSAVPIYFIFTNQA